MASKTGAKTFLNRGALPQLGGVVGVWGFFFPPLRTPSACLIVSAQIMHAFSVAPFDQNLSIDGKILSDDTATLGSLGVIPESVILLKVTGRARLRRSSRIKQRIELIYYFFLIQPKRNAVRRGRKTCPPAAAP